MKRKYIIAFIFLILLLTIPNILAFIIAKDVVGWGMHTLYLLSTIAFYLLGLSILKQRTFFRVYSPFLLIGAVEIVYLILNQATTSLMFIYTIVKAELGEFLELVSTYWPIVFIFVPLWTGYFIANRKHIPKNYLFENKLIRYSVAAACCLFFIISASAISLHKHKHHDADTAFIALSKTCPINLVVQSVHLADMWDDMNGEAQSKLQDFSFGIPAKQDSEPEIVLLLIGETSRYQNWGINGYHRNTTPLLAAQPNLISYDSCFTIANLTAVSVKYLLSRATPHDKDITRFERTLPEAFHEAGYQTAWIANQSYTNRYLSRIAYSCDYLYYHKKELPRYYLDTVLLPPLQQFLADTICPKQFIVIHSLGSHFKYSSRYPESFQIYTPDMKSVDWVQLLDSAHLKRENIGATVTNTAAIDALREVLVNSYDNSITFVDFFINGVIESLKQTHKPALLLYVGDHGENLLDDDRNMMLHGTYSGSVYEWHVPLFIWTSDEYAALHPEKVQALKDNKTKHISTMNIYHSLLNMAQVDYPLLEADKCIDSTSLVPDTLRWGLDANLELCILPD